MSKKTRVRPVVWIILTAGAAAFAGWKLYRALNPITFTSNVMHVELGGHYDPYSNISSVYNGTASEVVFHGFVNPNSAGEYQVEADLNGRRQPMTVRVSDTQSPVLTVKNITVSTDTELDAESFIQSLEDISRTSVRILNPESLVNRAGTRTVEIEAIDEYGNKVIKSARLTRLSDIDETQPADLRDVSTQLADMQEGQPPAA